jgi:hypothetical protein
MRQRSLLNRRHDSQGNIIENSYRAGCVGQGMAQLWLLWHFNTMWTSGYVLLHQLMLMKVTSDRIGYGKGIKQALLGAVTLE